MRQALAHAITRLPDRERLVVTLYYYEELTLREIGEVLSVTESRAPSSTPRRSSACASWSLDVERRTVPSAPEALPRAPAPPSASIPRMPTPRAGVTAAMPGMATGPDRGWRFALDKLAATIAETS